MLDSLERIARLPSSPRLETLEEARELVRDLTPDEYALARVINSEADSRPTIEQACIADATVNDARARGKGLFAYITGGTGAFGEQGGVHKQSSARPPGPRHVEVALCTVRTRATVLPFVAPPFAGIAKGARQYLNPRVQDVLNKRDGSSTACPPLAILESWTYSRKIVSREDNGCQLATKRGGGQLEWVGPIAGVDPWNLMLMRPATAAQDRLYAEAVKVIESRGSYKGKGLPLAPVELLLVAGLIGAAYLGGLA